MRLTESALRRMIRQVIRECGADRSCGCGCDHEPHAEEMGAEACPSCGSMNVEDVGGEAKCYDCGEVFSSGPANMPRLPTRSFSQRGY